jgi:hypothetical protein
MAASTTLACGPTVTTGQVISSAAVPPRALPRSPRRWLLAARDPLDGVGRQPLLEEQVGLGYLTQDVAHVVDHGGRADLVLSKQTHQLLGRGRQPGADDLTGHDVAELGAHHNLLAREREAPLTLPGCQRRAGFFLLLLLLLLLQLRLA